ncbi:hypothetical protein GCM10027413_27970 [Conyzicola nivalis]|uniref:WxL domain-containing protein n=1 Tax=Conyzicola nivalis TaxID=1477021 RepID=A0A916SST4_9MICO|nr:hypothetical protein [Conyzicola nivalis]GGB14644.1 hypothetical protein GCM10010979_31540 [Conyzicola nivalis]
MSFNKTKIALAVGVATALISGSAISSAYAVESNGSSVAIYAWNTDTETLITPGTVVAWDQSSFGTTNKTDIDARFIGSADATDVTTFIAPRGQESVVTAWVATSNGGFDPGTKNVLQPNLSPSGMSKGNFATIRANGGKYSIGFAFVKNNGLTIADAGVVYHYIDIAPGGDYTFEDPAETVPTAPAAGTADITLSATTVAAAEGALSLVVPAGTTATIGNPTLVNNQSTSTGTLGDITVKDERFQTHKGWTLTSTVADFVAAGSTIPASQLLVTPKVVGTPIAGVVAAPAGAATTAGRPFAEASDGATVGDTVLNADLKFVAPSTAAAGVYTSKMTLTLTSK